jgi:hypothetical protein
MFEESQTYARFHRDNNFKVISIEVYNEPWSWGPNRFDMKTDNPLPQKKVPIVLSEKTLKAYAGKYTFAGDDYVKVRVDSVRIFVDTIGEIFPESETRFLSRMVDARIEFLKNPKGAITGLIWTTLGSVQAKKID